VLDMDRSVSPTHGEQEGTACNGHFGCTCYHPLFVFNQFGDLERCSLRQGNVHSAHEWRDVAKAEWHPGELYPCVGFIVTNLSRPDGRLVAFYNQRGTAEQYIKEGKNAVRWTHLSCQKFFNKEVRFQLHALAYNLGNFMIGRGDNQSARNTVVSAWPSLPNVVGLSTERLWVILNLVGGTQMGCPGLVVPKQGTHLHGWRD
jgi:hypothetical protein